MYLYLLLKVYYSSTNFECLLYDSWLTCSYIYNFWLCSSDEADMQRYRSRNTVISAKNFSHLLLLWILFWTPIPLYLGLAVVFRYLAHRASEVGAQLSLNTEVHCMEVGGCPENLNVAIRFNLEADFQIFQKFESRRQINWTMTSKVSKIRKLVSNLNWTPDFQLEWS